MRSSSSLLLAGALALSACADSTALEEAAPAALQGPLLVSNGANLNGANLNGANLNGPDLASTLVSVNYAGATREGLTGNKLDGVQLRGTEFIGFQGSSTFSGQDFNQAHFFGTLGDGRTVELLIASLSVPTAPDDIWTYRVKYWDAPTQGWRPLCLLRDGTEVDAMPVAGRWDYRQGVPGGGSKIDDPTTFTFACERSAITKCIRQGYKPWATVNGVSLAEHHQACTRLIRADFCGDGISYTVDGQWVNLYDAAGVQQDTEDWYLEAEWDTMGARCFSPHNRSHAHVSCYQERTQSACGKLSNFATGTLLMSESPYRN